MRKILLSLITLAIPWTLHAGLIGGRESGSLNASLQPTTVTSTPYTVLSNDTLILASATAAGISISLPTASSSRGRVLIITKVDTSTGTITINASGSDVISGTGTQKLNAYTQTDSIISDGVSRWIPWGQGLQITPTMIGPGFQSTTANSIGTSSVAVCGVFTTQVPVMIDSVTVHVAVTGGQMDAGIYDVNGNRLASTGGVAVPVAGRANIPLTSIVNLAPGTYWECLAPNNTTATFFSASGTTNQYAGFQSCSGVNYPLPTTLSFPCGNTTRLVDFNLWLHAVGTSN